MIRLRWVVVTVAIVAGFALAGGVAGQLGRAAAPASEQLQVERQLACPQCTETRLDVCDRPICLDMRADIAGRLARGQSPASIVAAYQAVYGPRVLADPPVDWRAAGLPWLAVLVGLGLVVGGRMGWRHRNLRLESM